MHEENRSERHAGPRETEVADRLRAGDPSATAAFLRCWIASVDRYCCTVCQPELVAQAIDVTFADFFEKLRAYPIADADLGPALKRCARLTAGEGALVDEREKREDDQEGIPFDCELTPLLLAGSPRAPVGGAVEERMRRHLGACPRCQASERRFKLAEERFQRAGEPELADRMLDAFLGQFAATPVSDTTSAPGFEAARTSGRQPSPGRETTIGRVDTRQDLSDVKEQLLARIRGLEFPLGELVQSMRNAMERESAASELSPDSRSQP